MFIQHPLIPAKPSLTRYPIILSARKAVRNFIESCCHEKLFEFDVRDELIDHVEIMRIASVIRRGELLKRR